MKKVYYSEINENDIDLIEIKKKLFFYTNNKALEMFQKGFSIYKISKELGIQWHTANNWLINNKHLPILIQNSGETSDEI